MAALSVEVIQTLRRVRPLGVPSTPCRICWLTVTVPAMTSTSSRHRLARTSPTPNPASPATSTAAYRRGRRRLVVDAEDALGPVPASQPISVRRQLPSHAVVDGLFAQLPLRLPRAPLSADGQLLPDALAINPAEVHPPRPLPLACGHR